MAEEVKLMKGNEAIAHAAIRYGVDGYFGYPITPQSEILETLMAEMPWETTGMVVLQAESEGSHQYGIWRCRYGQTCDDLLVQPRCQSETRRYILYRRSRTALSDRKRDAWRSRPGDNPAQPGRLFPDRQRRRTWRLPPDHARSLFRTGNGGLCRTGFRTRFQIQ